MGLTASQQRVHETYSRGGAANSLVTWSEGLQETTGDHGRTWRRAAGLRKTVIRWRRSEEF